VATTKELENIFQIKYRNSETRVTNKNGVTSLYFAAQFPDENSEDQ